jgi:hypothetical protein
MAAGLQIAMGILATLGLLYLIDTSSFLKKIFDRKKVLLWFLFIIFLGLSNYFLVVDDLIYYLNPPKVYSPYLSKNKQEAMTWLKQNTTEENIILASPENGNLLPAFSLRPVYIGQWSLTANQSIKNTWLKSFLSTFNSQTRFTFLKINKIDYLFFGSEEKAVANFNPEVDEFLNKVYQNSEVTIYRVKNQ